MIAMTSVLRNRYLLCTVGIATSYLLFEILRVNHFIGTLLRGEQYYHYYLMYVPVLLVLFFLYTMRRRSFESLGWSLVFGIVAGYIAGLIAYFFVVLTMGDGFARVANNARDFEHFLAMISAPLLYLSWIYGAFSAAGVYLINKRAARTK